MPHQHNNRQQLLLPIHPRALADKFGLNWWTVKKLYDDQWLSFDPEVNIIDDSCKEAEFTFLCTLVTAGCDPQMLKRLLSTLERPYCYNLSEMHYDWVDQCWKDYDSPLESLDKAVSIFEDNCDIQSLEELRQSIQQTLDRLIDNEDVSINEYNFDPRQDDIVEAASRLLWKLASSKLIDSPSKAIVVGKLFRVLQYLPLVAMDENLEISLVGPRRKFGDHEIYHFWTIALEENGYLKISSGGHFYRPQTGGDTFSSMSWEVTPGEEPVYNSYLDTLSIVDDADTFENEVDSIQLNSVGYELSVEDPTLEGMEAEDIIVEEDSMFEGSIDHSNSWIVSPFDEYDERLAGLINKEEVNEHEANYAYGAETCDYCNLRLDERGIFVDGKVRNSFEWANMCARCFEKHGEGIGWGRGQLYALQPNGDWRLVAGFQK